MRSAIPPAPASFRIRHFAVLAALPVLTLALLPASGVASTPRAHQFSGATIPWEVARPSQALRIELAGNKKKGSDDDFDPYGKDDPTSKKWGISAGLGGNRYGGLNTGGDAKKKPEKNSDRDDREPRPPREEEGGRN